MAGLGSGHDGSGESDDDLASLFGGLGDDANDADPAGRERADAPAEPAADRPTPTATPVPGPEHEDEAEPPAAPRPAVPSYDIPELNMPVPPRPEPEPRERSTSIPDSGGSFFWGLTPNDEPDPLVHGTPSIPEEPTAPEPPAPRGLVPPGVRLAPYVAPVFDDEPEGSTAAIEPPAEAAAPTTPVAAAPAEPAAASAEPPHVEQPPAEPAQAEPETADSAEHAPYHDAPGTVSLPWLQPADPTLPEPIGAEPPTFEPPRPFDDQDAAAAAPAPVPSSTLDVAAPVPDVVDQVPDDALPPGVETPQADISAAAPAGAAYRRRAGGRRGGESREQASVGAGSGSGSRGPGGVDSDDGGPSPRAQRIMLIVAGALLVVLLVIAMFIVGRAVSHPVTTPTPTPTKTTATPTPTPTPTVAAAGPVSPGKHGWNELRGGECLQPFTTPWANTFTVVDCSQAHAAQMVYTGAFSTDPKAAFPGASQLASQINVLCSRPGILNLDAAGTYTDAQIQGTYPVTEKQWTSGERSYYCFVNRSSGQPITGSLAGPGPQ